MVNGVLAVKTLNAIRRQSQDASQVRKTLGRITTTGGTLERVGRKLSVPRMELDFNLVETLRMSAR